MSESILALTDVTVRYGGVVAVDEVSFELDNGAIHGLVGPNGSGKSTLLAAVSGTRPADGGSIRFDGHETRKWTPWRLARHGLARTFQGARVVPDLTVRENVALGLDWNPVRKHGGFVGRRARTASAVDDALETCGIARIADSIASDLSYGTQRLVEIARAVVAQPRLLLLDEPTAGMNELERAEIEAVQRKLGANGVTQVLVEHNMGMVVRLCAHVFVLNSGKLIASGSPNEIVNNPDVQKAYLGKVSEHATAAASH
ncbi:MAG: ABC transporter ATP-binding protein [Actinomycetota bacterium]